MSIPNVGAMMRAHPWTAEPRIARLEFDDGLDECLVRPFRAGLPRARRRREQPAVLATHQRLMKRQERRRAEGDGDLSDAFGTEEERAESAGSKNWRDSGRSIERRRIRRDTPGLGGPGSFVVPDVAWIVRSSPGLVLRHAHPGAESSKRIGTVCGR